MLARIVQGSHESTNQFFTQYITYCIGWQFICRTMEQTNLHNYTMAIAFSADGAHAFKVVHVSYTWEQWKESSSLSGLVTIVSTMNALQGFIQKFSFWRGGGGAWPKILPS